MGPRVQVVDMTNGKREEMALSEEVFGAEVKPLLMHEVIKMQLANRRQGTASTRTRSEVRGGGKKPWKQKGTGRARAGTIRSPLWRGGGTVFGPKPRNYGYLVPRQVRAAALRAALSSKVQEGRLLIVENLSPSRPATKGFKVLLESLGIEGRVLIVTDQVQGDPGITRSCRNLPHVGLLPALGLNVYDVLKYDTLLITRSALGLVEEAWKP